MQNDSELAVYTYDPDGTLLSVEVDGVSGPPMATNSEDGDVTRYTYDADGNLIETVTLGAATLVGSTEAGDGGSLPSAT